MLNFRFFFFFLVVCGIFGLLGFCRVQESLCIFLNNMVKNTYNCPLMSKIYVSMQSV